MRSLTLSVSSIIFIVLYSGWIDKPYAQELGRLFTTPMERKTIESNRKRNVRKQDATTVTGIPNPPTETKSSKYKLDGVLIRQDGNKTIWVKKNNTLKSTEVKHFQNQNETDPTHLKIKMLGGDKNINLKPGQIYDSKNKTVREAYQSHSKSPLKQSVECVRRDTSDSLSELICTKK